MPETPTLRGYDEVFAVSVAGGLHDDAYAIAAAVVGVERYMVLESFEARLPDTSVSDDWARRSVLPVIDGWEQIHNSTVNLEEAFWSFYAQHCLEQGQWGPTPRKNMAVIAMFGSPVKSGLFQRCVERYRSRTSQAPYPLHEVGTLLLALGEEQGDSVEAYLKKHRLRPMHNGSAVNPTYCAVTAAEVWIHAMARIQNRG